MKKTDFAAADLITSPMRHMTLLVPEILVDAIDAAAVRDDPSSPNRSSFVRRAIIAALRREAA
jgi:metal-responsive CopG/Arc/MetJ family transcriptional regulator